MSIGGLSIGKGTLLGTGYIKVTADTSAAEEKLGGLGKGLAIGAAGLLGLAAGGAAAVTMANNFNNAMLMIQTQAGGSAKDVQYLTNAVLNMKDVQQSPEQLAEALYHLKSVGLDNVSAMKDLKIASQLASVGNSDLEATTNALAGAWRSGIRGAQDMGQAAATVNAIIGAGNMRMQDFVSAISTGILPSAKTFGLSLQSVGAAMALMTDEGIPAVDAATRLRMSFSLMGAPSGAASKALKTIGLTGLQLADAMRGPDGIIGAIQLLKDHLDASGLSASQQAALLSKAFGGGRSNSAILTMLNNLDTLKKKQDQINKSMGDFPAAVAAQQQTFSAQLKIMENSLQEIGIKIGEALIGPITWFVTFLNATAIPAITNFFAVVTKALPVQSFGSGLSSFFKAFAGPGTAAPGSSATSTPLGFSGGAAPVASAPTFLTGAGGSSSLSSSAPSLPSVTRGLGGHTYSDPVVAPQTAWTQMGTQLKSIFTGDLVPDLKNIATALGDIAVSAQNLFVAIEPLLGFLATTGLKTLDMMSSILGNQLGPALKAVTGFVKDNSAAFDTLLTLYLAPLLVKMTALGAIKSVKSIADLAKDVVNFPIDTTKKMISAVQDFTKPGGSLDDLRLKAGYAGDALKTFGGKVGELAQASWQTVTTQVGNLTTGAKMLWQNITQLASAGWSKITTAASSVGSTLASAGSQAATFFSNMASGAASLASAGWEKITTSMTAMAAATQAAAAAAWEWVASASASVAAAAREVIAWIAEKVAIVGSTIAEAAMTVAQLALNLAMSLNPLGLIVLALVAVGVGMYELWQHSSTFRSIVTGVFKSISDAADFMWNNVLKPTFKFLVETFLSVADDIIHGATTMFGWVPGVGGLLKSAAAEFDKFRASVNASLNGINDKTVPVTITFNGVPEGSVTNHSYTSTTGWSYAEGGPIRGGTPGKDSVLILAMPDEHVLTASDVRKMGGHQAVYSMRRSIQSGNVPAYAAGGPVRAGSFTMDVTRPADTNSVNYSLIPLTGSIINKTVRQITLDYINAFKAAAAAAASSGAAGLTNAGGFAGAASGAAQTYAQSILGRWFWGGNQMGPLIKLWNQESGWRWDALNPSSGAYGIPQALPADKMASAGPDWRTNYQTQIRWGLGYIAGRYGSPANAWAHEVGFNWYDRGGWLPTGPSLVYNGTGRPERVIGPQEEHLLGGGNVTLEVHFHAPVGSPTELENWLTRALVNLKRNGRLRTIVPGT